MSSLRALRRRHPRVPAVAPIASSLLFAVALSACATSATPPPDPAAACGGADVQRSTGFYPDLERLVPSTLDGAAPAIRDSGRYCSRKMLGPLFDAGHEEVRFAGSTFPATGQSGTSLIVYRSPGLLADDVAAAFRAGSGSGRRVQLVSDEPRDVGGSIGRRIELINGDTRQVVVVWPAGTPDTVDIVIGVDVSNAAIDAAVDAFASFEPG
jgi:hypothetical protein